MLQNEIKPSKIWSLHSLSIFKIIYIYETYTERQRGLEICHMFTDSIIFKQQIYCSFLQMGWVYTRWMMEFFVDVIITWSLMLKNVFALVPVLQWNSHHAYFLVYVRTIANLYSTKYYQRKKTKNLTRTTSCLVLLSDCFKRKPPAHLPKSTSFEWSQEWSSHTGFTVTQKLLYITSSNLVR